MKKILLNSFALLALAHIGHAAEMTQYSHGDPTADEQYMLELINRARGAPASEGRFLAGQTDSSIKSALDYYDVDLRRVRRDFGGYQASPPLTFHPSLLAAARRHSNDMAKKNFQSHTGSDNSSPTGRVNDAGYAATTTNENIFASLVPTTLFAHVGLNVDWGPYQGGVQPELMHRKSIMGIAGENFREIGIGIATRTGESATKNGKLAVTQNFGNRHNSPAFLVGVAYSDTNMNGIYDPGEGLAGIQVMPETGSSYAVTSTSGGYSIPFPPASGASRVTFNGTGLSAPVTSNFSISGQNVKLDLRLTVDVPPVPLVGLEKVDSVARESGPKSGRTAVFRVSRAGQTAGDLRVEIGRSVSSSRGKASPKDYKITANRPASLAAPAKNRDRFTVIIPSGKSHADIRITAVSDKQSEPKEVVSFSLRSGKNYQASKTSTVKITIKK